LAAYSINGKIVSAYSNASPLFFAYRIPDLAKTPVLQAGQGTYNSGSGTPDVTQIAQWVADGPQPNSYAVVTVVYDQSGKGNDASQAVLASAPKLRIEPTAPAGSTLALIFGNDTGKAQSNYSNDPANGSNLTIGSLTNSNPTALTYAPFAAPSASPSPYPSPTAYPNPPPYPRVESPQYWILPGALVQDKSLPANGLTVLSSTATGLVLNGQPLEENSFSTSLTVTPGQNWLDIPASVSVNMNSHTMLMAVRSGCTGSEFYMTLGQTGEAPASSSNAYSALYNTNTSLSSFAFSANDPSLKTNPSVDTPLASAYTSDDVDVYSVARNNGTVLSNLGEVGVNSDNDGYASVTSLSAGSIGFTQQVSAKGQGPFEGYAFLVYGSALSAHDSSVISQTVKAELAVPDVPSTQVVYTGSSTVVGHGIDSVENPAKRISVDMAAAGHPVRTYTQTELSADLWTDLTTGTGPVSQMYQTGTGTRILVIHPTVSDSFRGLLTKGKWPNPPCGPPNSIPIEQCLWNLVSGSITAAHAMGWKVLLLGTEPKICFFEQTNGTMTNFLNFKALELNNWKAAGADGYMDMESSPYFGGTDGKGGQSHCPFWQSACIPNYLDPIVTQEYWQPDGQHFQQAGYDLSGDMISQALVSLGLY
jgi:hypothetical protein